MKVSFWDILTFLFISTSIALIVVVVIIFIKPDSTINPFPYPTMPSTLSVPTFTPAPVTLPPTWTPTPKITVTPNP